jgi:hypothetical protein
MLATAAKRSRIFLFRSSRRKPAFQHPRSIAAIAQPAQFPRFNSDRANGSFRETNFLSRMSQTGSLADSPVLVPHCPKADSPYRPTSGQSRPPQFNISSVRSGLHCAPNSPEWTSKHRWMANRSPKGPGSAALCDWCTHCCGQRLLIDHDGSGQNIPRILRRITR